MFLTDELPESDDFEVIQFKAKQMIVDQINKWIAIWCVQNKIKDSSYQLFDLFIKECKLIESTFSEINQIKLGIKPPLENKTFQEKTETSSDFDSSSSSIRFSTEEKIILATTSPLWIPLMIGVTVVAIPVVIGSVIKNAVLERRKIRKYRENKIYFMFNLAEEELKNYNAELVYSALCVSYLRQFMSELEKVCKQIIPKQIKADKEMIENIMKETRDYQTLKLEYTPIERNIKEIFGNLLYVKIKYMSDFQPRILRERTTIGRGYFGHVQYCDVDIGGNKIQCAVRRLATSIQSDPYLQLSLADKMM